VRTIVIASLVAISVIGCSLWLWTPDKARSALEAKYLKSPGDIIVVLGTHLHVRDTGPRDGPAIVLLHGFGSSLHTWESWATDLEREHRVIRFDLPGSGLSEPDTTGNYSDFRTMVLLAALMDCLGVPQASLVGNSVGGRIAWRFAAAYPMRVTKLVLISPDGFASDGFAYGQQPKVPAAFKLMQYVLPKAVVRTNLASAYGNVTALTDQTVNRYYDLMLAPGARGAMIERMHQTILEDPDPLLKMIRTPTLLIWGEKDALIPLRNAADYLRKMPNSKLVSFSELGHVPQEEDPVRSLQPVLSFLDQ
jgi:pimeloyl-ACP methyl ester carboxylesterase